MDKISGEYSISDVDINLCSGIYLFPSIPGLRTVSFHNKTILLSIKGNTNEIKKSMKAALLRKKNKKFPANVSVYLGTLSKYKR